MESETSMFAEVLQPSVAGQFYPSNPSELRQSIRSYIDDTTCEVTNRHVMSALVPHAGYIFSAPIAGYSFKHISQQNPDTVLFVALSHKGVQGGCVFSGAAMETPLGKVNVDEQFTSALLSQGSPFYADITPYHGEHSIEVNLPFVQEVFPTANLSCILLSRLIPEDCQQIGNGIAKVLQQFTNKNILILISSDMSHFPNYQDANRVDQTALKVLETVNPYAFVRQIKQISAERIPNLQCVMCGSPAMLSVLETAKVLGVHEGKVLKYCNSGDSKHGDHERVVGYGSAVWYYPDHDPNKLSSKNKQELLTIARKSIEAHLNNRQYEPDTNNQKLFVERGVFITVKYKGELRGCLGRFDATGHALYQLTAGLAAEASTNDNRFKPLSLDELPDTIISISVLSPEEKVINEHDIIIGMHGIKIVNGMMNGTLLPQVAAERNWNAVEFLEHTCMKANLHRGAWKEPNTDIYVYEADVFSDEDFQLNP